MLKHKRLFQKITLISSAAVLSASLIPLAFVTTASNKTVVAKANSVANDTKYVPLEISDSSLDSNVFITDSTSSEQGGWENVAPIDKKRDRIGDKVDASCAWYTTDAHTPPSGGSAFEPENNVITITSQQTSKTPGLEWQIKNINVPEAAGSSKLKNNAVRLWNADGHKTKTLKFNNLGVYKENLYLLVTAANNKGQSTQLDVTINYTKGDPTTSSFQVYDWCADASLIGENLASNKHWRFLQQETEGGTGGPYWSDNIPKFVQCGITVDPSRLIDNIVVSFPNNDNMIVTVYGVAGVISNIDAPTGLAATTPTKTTTTLSWNAVETANAYSLDISTDKTFSGGFLEGYEAKKIESTSEEVTNLYPGTTYYARVRSIDANQGQSKASDFIEFKADDVEAGSIQVFDMKSNVAKGEEFTFTSLVNGERIGGKYYPYPDQKIDWTISPNDGLTITEGEATQSGGKYWVLKGTKAGSTPYTVTGTKAGHTYSTTITVTPPMPTGLNIDFTKGRDDQLTVSWSAVENIDHFVLTVSDNESFTGEPIYHSADIAPDTTSITIDNVSDKKVYYARLLTEADNVKSNPIYANINHTPWWTWWIVAGSIMGGGLFISMAPIISVANNKRLLSTDAKEKNKK